MGVETRLFKSKERHSREAVSDFLRQLADKVAEGRVVLRQGDSELAMELPENLVLEVQVEDEEKRNRGTQRSLELELKWYDGDDEQAGVLSLG